MDSIELPALVAHDLRGPLGCIQGYAELLKRGGLADAERATLASRILSCSRFMERLVEDLLDAQAIERGELAVRLSPAELGPILERAVGSLKALADKRGATLRLSLPDTPAQAVADAARVEQVVQNLVSNALKHVTPGRGSVEVRLRAAGEDWIVEVADDGSGIAPEHLGRIFEKFYRADDVCPGSLGLGLHIARSIVSAHGGRLLARSEGPGRGATFSFSLPAYDPELAFRRYKDARAAVTPPPRQAAAA